MHGGKQPFLIREGGMQFVPEAVITCRQGHHHHRFLSGNITTTRI